MKQFITHILYFLAAFCLTQVACNNLLLKNTGDSYFHNKQFATQYRTYLSKQSEVNTLFFGSSRTYRQVNPQIIDRELAAFNIHSYNLGAPGTFVPESFYLFNHFLDHLPQDGQTRYVFFELTSINKIKLVNWFAPQSYYYIDWDMLRLVWNIHVHQPDMSLMSAAFYTYPYLQGYLVNQIMPKRILEPAPGQEISTGENEDGYYPLDLEQEHNEKLRKRRTEFLSDTTILQERKQNQLQRKKEGLSENFVNYLNQLIEMAEQKNVKLYYVLPPKLKDYTSLAALDRLIRDQRLIDMGNDAEYPYFNFAEYNFDRGHLNHRGAELYSKYLAEKMKERLQGQADKNTQGLQ